MGARGSDGSSNLGAREDLARFTLVELRKKAKEMGVKGAWKLRKDGLVEVLSGMLEGDEDPTEVAADPAAGASGRGEEAAAGDPDASLSPSLLAACSLEELRQMASRRGDIANPSKLRKAELVAELCQPRHSAGAEDGSWPWADGAGAPAKTFDASSLEPLAENDLFAVDPDLYSYLKESTDAVLGANATQGGPPGASSGDRLSSALSSSGRRGFTHITVAVICGGPTGERGISLNSARSLADHLKSDKTEIKTYYVDRAMRAHTITSTQLYSNTPSDFDFKLQQSDAPSFESLEELVESIKLSADVCFPVLHGAWGEDGRLQAMLEAAEVPFVGSSSAACARAFDKFSAGEHMRAAGHRVVPSLEVREEAMGDLAALEESVSSWCRQHGFDEGGCFVAKPCLGGSSIGVVVTHGVPATAQALLERRRGCEAQAAGCRCVVQPFVEGVEFTVNVVETKKGPVALVPTEVELCGSDEGGKRIFDFRRKYLPSTDVRLHSPPVSFPANVAEAVMRAAEDVFASLELRDFARIDGWYLAPEEASRVLGPDAYPVLLSDINITPGIEQNSFFFQQAAEAGLSHSALLRCVMHSACARSNMQFPEGKQTLSGSAKALRPSGGVGSLRAGKQRVFVLCGGETSERQVSLMSGLNCWLKLSKYSDLHVQPFLLVPPVGDREAKAALYDDVVTHRGALLAAGCAEADLPDELQPSLLLSPAAGGAGGVPKEQWKVWGAPYPAMLYHTVEEADKYCEDASTAHLRSSPGEELHPLLPSEMTVRRHFAGKRSLAQGVHARLKEAGVLGLGTSWDVGGSHGDTQPSHGDERPPQPERLTLQTLVEKAKAEEAVVFLALHGGLGEDGTVQAMLEQAGVRFTGSPSAVAATCMDKLRTADALSHFGAEGVRASPKRTLRYSNLQSYARDPQEAQAGWDLLCSQLESDQLCVKPCADGCSTGVAKLASARDVAAYAQAVCSGAGCIPEGTLSEPHGDTPLPENPFCLFVVEPFVRTAEIRIRGSESGGEEGAEGRGGEALEMFGDSRWIEVTVGLVGKPGQMKAMLPSLTVREQGSILTLQEKFQGGTGVNLTPPPPEVVSPAVVKTVQMRLELTASLLGLAGFARVDAFIHVDTAEIVVIEVNSTPGLTPSTALFHQGLAEDPPVYPEQLFRAIVDCA